MSLSYRLIEVEYEENTIFYIQWFKKDKIKSLFSNTVKGIWYNVFGHSYKQKEEALKIFNTYYAKDREKINNLVIKNIIVLDQNLLDEDKNITGIENLNTNL